MSRVNGETLQMAALSKLAIHFSATQSPRASDLAVATLFSLIGLAIALLAERYGIDIGDGI